MKQQMFELVPKEFLEQPRWFLVEENKKPLTKGWTDPANQCRYNEVVGGYAGFDTCGHGQGDDYCLLDFDHITNDGKTNEDAAKIIKELFEQGIYVEHSISGHGDHILIKPTPRKFGKITPKDGKGILWFDKPNNVKLEIFYASEGRYCLITGYKRAGGGDRIPAGEEADAILDKLLNMIREQSQDATLKQSSHSNNETSPQPNRTETTTTKSAKKICADTPEYTAYRFARMIDCVPIRDLHGDDWLAAMTACKAAGMTYPEFDAINVSGENYNAEENFKRWNSVNPSGDWLGALHNLAKIYGYSEAETLKSWRQENPSAPAQIVNRSKQNAKFSSTLTDEQRQALYSGDASDTDNADRLALLYHDELKFLVPDGYWYLLEHNEDGGAVWKNFGDKKFSVYPFVRRLSDTLIANAVKVPKEIGGVDVRLIESGKLKSESLDAATADKVIKEYKQKKELRKRQLSLGKKLKMQRNISAAIEILKGSDEIAITAEDLNKHTNLLNVQNGVIDLETGRLYRPAEKLDFMPTNIINAVFDAQVDCSFVEKFFREVLPDKDTCAAVLRYLGYCLSGDKLYHISEFWRGSGSNGKSTLLDLLLILFNTYGIKLPNLSLIQSNRPIDANAATPALASLGGDIRLAVVDELPRNVRLNADLYKTITGDATARARFLHQNLETVQLRAKLILNGNFLPAFDIDDGGLKRRITRVEFTQHFDPDTGDPLLPKKLSTPENRAALLKILVYEAQEVYRNGLLESSAMADAKTAYFAENDFVADFIDERLIIGDGGQILRKTLEEKICADYPNETRRLKKKELFDLLKQKLESLGAEYTKAKANANVFKNAKLIDD